MKRIILPLLVLLLSRAGAQQWTLTGPTLFPGNVSGQINGIGRVCKIVFDPLNHARMYAASASGGLWISNDTAHTWQRTGTETMPRTQCSDLCVDYTNTQVIYLATGDPNYYGESNGIWKSMDGGQTFAPCNNNIGNRMALGLLMSPYNHLELIAATDNGLWKSYDGGASWVMKVNGGNFFDLKFRPAAGSRVVYACANEHFYRSTDMGDTWTQITNGVTDPMTNHDGLGTRIAVSAADTNRVYLGFISGTQSAVLVSHNGGNSFSLAHFDSTQNLGGYDAVSNGQANYNFDLAANPSNADELYYAAHVVWKSLDAGGSWTQETQWWAGLHTDMHHILVDPYDHHKLFESNDGGVWLSRDDGPTWTPMSDGLDATEIYQAGQSQLTRNVVSIGTQDNGELYYLGGVWNCNRGGDWGPRVVFDRQQANWAYYDFGNRKDLAANNETSLGIPSGQRFTYAFSALQPLTAFACDSVLYRCHDLQNGSPAWINIYNFNKHILASAWCPADSNLLYLVSADDTIYRSNNALSAVPVFTPLPSPGPTNVAASITALASDHNKVYISCGSRVYRSTNQGASWTDVSGNLLPINILALLSDDYAGDEEIYAGTAKGVYFKDSTNQNWYHYHQGLPTIADLTGLMMFNNNTPSSALCTCSYGRGVWEAPLLHPATLRPQADFTADQTLICPLQAVQFGDLSYGHPTSWQWSFPGGNPTSSSNANPLVSYNISGQYPVTLVVSNGNGSDTLTLTAYISVLDTLGTPLTQGFEGNFPPNEWHKVDGAQDGAVWKPAGFGGYGLSGQSAFFDNYSYNVPGTRDELVTPRIHVSGLSELKLRFDVAYSVFPGYTDSLAVLLTSDCGATFHTIYLKGGDALATVPAQGNYFTPVDTSWRTDTVELSSYIGAAPIQLYFENRAGYGNCLYIDNILLDSTFHEPNGVTAPSQNALLKLFPNPNDGSFSLSLPPSSASYHIEVMNLMGKLMLQRVLPAATETGFPRFTIPGAVPGMYLVHIYNDQLNKSLSFVVGR